MNQHLSKVEPQIVIAAFYKFVPLPDATEMHEPLRTFCQAHNLRGSILLAAEGINGTVAGERADVDALLARLRADARLADLEHKESYASFRPFRQMKVRLKAEIVTIKSDEADPTREVGQYVPPESWNDLIRRDDVILIDTRNDFEYDYGTFEGAINPNTESFGDFPDYVQQNLDPAAHKKVAMFCTGGIRCEKASSYLLSQGFEEVYHLQGGILKYLEQVPRDETLWQGECFVFDEREALDHDLQPRQQKPPDGD